MNRLLSALVLAGVLGACATLGGSPAESAADARFRAIYETEWEWRQASEPEEDSDTPDEEKAPRTWGKVDPATQAERLAYMKGQAFFRDSTTLAEHEITRKSTATSHGRARR
jgi:hypothetical protein